MYVDDSQAVFEGCLHQANQRGIVYSHCKSLKDIKFRVVSYFAASCEFRVEEIPIPNCLPSRENKKRIIGEVSPNPRFRNRKGRRRVQRKRVVVRNADDANEEVVLPNDVNDGSPMFLSPVGFHLGAVTSPMDLAKQNNLLMIPKTPGAVEGMLESRLESLPRDLLVNILCHLLHDQLKAVFHVSQKIRKAVIMAKQFHFNYTTPNRMQQDMLGTITPLPTDHWPSVSKGDGKGAWVHSPRTPQAPKHGPKPPSRLKFIEMEQIATVLLQESAFPSRALLEVMVVEDALGYKDLKERSERKICNVLGVIIDCEDDTDV
ncbi:hypothetical protein K7X08_018305 [Anisodus acutangulus]|uniref:F-box domain-containing protein n=1 Tax=Anisodus acutangulus TaxID=402998 RepID=A0A9Q1LYY6_9SOLA|nr:hypothetical protein K7X08_018305 [Anisodus acutangulus]